MTLDGANCNAHKTLNSPPFDDHKMVEGCFNDIILKKGSKQFKSTV